MNDAKKLEIKIEINFGTKFVFSTIKINTSTCLKIRFNKFNFELLILKFSISLVNTVFMCN